ncbi:MAG: SDR family oxidoreductase [Burkholderiales bacterium]|nr:SDR family oxidoreductase [Burkholderiales bacterium]
MKSLAHLFRLDNRIAVITGGSSGIGRAMAYALGAQGAKLVLVARSADTLAETVRDFATDGITACAVAADLGDEAERARAIGEANAAFGAPDILVNAAANNIRKPLPELSSDEIRATLALNLEAPLALIQAFAPAMQARGWGRIINVTSQQAQRAFNHSGVYGVSKGGLASLTRSTAEYYSRFGVTCNSLSPGFVVTPLTVGALNAQPGFAERHAAASMIGRNGVPDDFMGAAIFLASDASALVTGHSLFVDGGYGAK